MDGHAPGCMVGRRLQHYRPRDGEGVIAASPAPSGAQTTDAAGLTHAGAPSRSRQAGRVGAVLAILLAAAVSCVVGLEFGAPPSDPAYLAGALAIVGAMVLRFRLVPEASPSTVVLLPLTVTYGVFGNQALPALILGDLVAGLVARYRPLTLATAVGHKVLAFAFGQAVASAVPGGLFQADGAATVLSTQADAMLRTAAFAIAFHVGRLALWWVAGRWSLPPADDRAAEEPDPLISLLLIPLALAAMAAEAQFGPSAFLIGTASLRVALSVVAAVASLRAARMLVEVERDRLARATALQDELLHLMTHDLKNPLTTVRVYAQLGQKAVQDGRTDRLNQYLANVDRAGMTIERMVENLLQLSRLEQASEQPLAEAVPGDELAVEVLDTLRTLAEQKGIDLTLETPQPVPVFHVSTVLAREALSNLVSNAIKYTPGGGSVRVRVALDEQPGFGVASVADTGIGLSEEDLARLFSKFFRSANPQARQERGTGLGLALTHAIVTRVGGRIQVESKLDQGTTFRLLLPLA